MFKLWKLIQQRVVCAIYAFIIYAIWKARNEAVWNNLVRHPTFIIRNIQREIKLRLTEFQLEKHHSCSRFITQDDSKLMLPSVD